MSPGWPQIDPRWDSQGQDRDLYAVASSIMHLPHANAVSEGLTLLPPGQSWLSRALLCSGTPVEDLPQGHDLRSGQARAGSVAD